MAGINGHKHVIEHSESESIAEQVFH